MGCFSFLRTLCMAVNFYLENRLDKDGDAAIRVSIMVRGARLVTSSGCKINPDKWDKHKQQVKRGAYNAISMTWSQINSRLTTIKDHFNRIELLAIEKNESVSADSLKEEFRRLFRAKDVEGSSSSAVNELGFWDYYEMFVKDRGVSNQWTKATYQKFAALERHLKDWMRCEVSLGKDLSFGAFSESGLVGFVGYMRDVLKMKNTTIGKQLGYLKWFLKWASEKGYNMNMAFRSFNPKLKTAKKIVVFLDWEELMRVKDFTVPRNGEVVRLRTADGKEYEKRVSDAAALVKTRDIFCFCCFTSLRFSDANNLKRSNIRDDKLNITTVKTNDTIQIELNKYAREILERYADSDFGGYALPRITNQRMNVYLKELCELCGINEPVTQTFYRGNERIEETKPKYEYIGTHTGRRTFICNALMMGIPAQIVMKWTGHADYKSMSPYIEVADRAKAAAMRLFDER